MLQKSNFTVLRKNCDTDKYEIYIARRHVSAGSIRRHLSWRTNIVNLPRRNDKILPYKAKINDTGSNLASLLRQIFFLTKK